MAGYITQNYGTWRGLVRSALAHGEVALGRHQPLRPDPSAIRRLVFVCHGNICRSAYAQQLALAAGLRATGFGLATSAGAGAHPPLVAAAAARGTDLGQHQSQRVEDYVPQDGDILLVMEVRQMRRIAADPQLGKLPRQLLGLYAHPPTPHIHDPYGLDDAFLPACLRRIEAAVAGLAAKFPGARL
ncbi:MAG: phosphotyrosine protein phosphatase [Sphingomonadaceae bacterium]|nr:phosphotyrosine protein phosphatase [Sphingomonadaceae bacterium]